MSLPKIKRNKDIVKRVDKGEKISALAEEYNVKRQTVHEVYHREKAKVSGVAK